MIELPYYAFIEPLEFAMHEFLVFAQSLTGSWGFSLVLLSLAVNIVLLPLYHLAEGWQEAERVMQKNMAPKLKEIKEVFSGRERYMYIRALYRLHGYKPLYALRAAFGLLIQIPFFFAAYHLLNHMPALNGVSWLCFADLSKPDALLSLGSFSLNILPFVMTAANLVSAAVYTSRLSAREKRNLLLLALLFLVLLYPSSSALLIYWTCNNIFSLGKNLVYLRRYSSHTKTGPMGSSPVNAKRSSRVDLPLAGLSVITLIVTLTLRKHLSTESWMILPLASSLVLACLSAYLRHTTLRMQYFRHDNAPIRGLLSFSVVMGSFTALFSWKLVNFKKLYDYDDTFFYLLFSLELGIMAAWVILRCPPLHAYGCVCKKEFT